MYKTQRAIAPYYLTATLLVVAAFSACSTSRAPAAFNLIRARSEIEAANKQFVDMLAKGDAKSLADFFTEDAKSMGPNEAAHEGRDKIRSVYQGFIDAGMTRMSLTTTGVWGTAEMLAEEGS